METFNHNIKQQSIYLLKTKQQYKMIYKGITQITNLYLGNNLISKGYKGEVQFFGQTQPVSSSTTITIQEIAEQEQWATGVNLENTATYGGFTFDFTGGAKYYTSGGSNLRVYSGNQITISGNQIYAIKFTTTTSQYNFVDNDCSQDDIFYNEGAVQTFVFSSGESSVSFTNGDNTQIRIVQMEIFTSLDYTTAPTISYDEQTKTVTATATGNETVILYVNGGPNENPYSLAENYGTNTVYAMGVEEGKLPNKSETLTITIENPYVPEETTTITVADIADQEGWQSGITVNNFTYNNFQFSGSGLTYFNSSSNPHNIRVQKNGTGNMTIQSNEANITSVTFTCTTQSLSFTSEDAPNYTFKDNGDLTQTFSDINSTQFTINNHSSSYRRWTQVVITTQA